MIRGPSIQLPVDGYSVPSAAGARQIERQQPRQDLLVGERRGPAVGGEDRGVELAMRVVEPRGPRVVEVGERALPRRPDRSSETCQVGRVEPRVAQPHQLLRGLADGLHAGIVRRLLARRPGEGEGFEAGGGCVAEVAFRRLDAVACPAAPTARGRESAGHRRSSRRRGRRRRGVLSGNVRVVDPDKDPMLGILRALQYIVPTDSDCSPHRRTRLDRAATNVLAFAVDVAPISDRLDMRFAHTQMATRTAQLLARDMSRQNR